MIAPWTKLDRRGARAPQGRDWRELGDRDLPSGPGTMWARGAVQVLSTLDVAEYPDGSGTGPQWHISITRAGGRRPKRPRPRDVGHALEAFGMVGCEEDNHHPGNARHFWLPVDPTKRVDCECKESEVTIVDPRDGYTWTNPHAGEGACRGCELVELLGRPCPIHGPPELIVQPWPPGGRR